MAITTTTISKAAGWARTDVIYQTEEAFKWLGWHGSRRTGIVTAISAYSGGGTVGSSNTDFHDVFPVSTTGIGTGASFYVQRNGGVVDTIYVNRPGVGYTNGERVTLSAADIGGSANGAVAIGITVLVAGGASPTGFGTTTAFYDSDISGTYPWGVVRHQIQANKKFGDTYRGFQTISDTQMNILSGSGFHPWNSTNFSDKANMYANRWAGSRSFDINVSPTHPYLEMSSSTYSGYNNITTLVFAYSNSYKLDLNIYRSGLDPNFAVFAYKHPDLSSTSWSNNNFAVFFVHNFTSSLWDLNNLYLGGMTVIYPDSSPTASPKITFNTYLSPDNGSIKRSAEWGYSNSGATPNKYTYYESSIYINQYSANEVSFYYRDVENSKGGDNDTETLSSNTFYNAVIKGIPLATQIAPVPYYLPDDFVLINFKINTPSVNVQQGDTITISGSEVYTVIAASYGQSPVTAGIAFCGRKI